MRAFVKHSLQFVIGAALVAIIALFAFSINKVAAQYSNTVVANVNVGNVIYILVTPSSNEITPVYPGQSYPTTVQFTDNDNGGNLAANIFVENGTAWYLDSNTAITFGASNAVWAATNGVAFSSATPLSNTLTNTHITIPLPTISSPDQSNVIFFGVNIPAAAPAGVWTLNVIFENENLTSPTTNSITYTVQFEANVQKTCYISLSPNTVNFGTIYAGANVPTEYLVTDKDNGGNTASNVIIYGSNWILTSNPAVSFGVSNTLYDSSNTFPNYAGTPLTLSPVTTNIVIPAPAYPTGTSSSNSIYFGLGIPPGTEGGAYTQNITIENSC